MAKKSLPIIAVLIAAIMVTSCGATFSPELERQAKSNEIIHEKGDNFFVGRDGSKITLNSITEDGAYIENPYVIIFDSDGTKHIFNKPDPNTFGPEPTIIGIGGGTGGGTLRTETMYFEHDKYCMGTAGDTCGVINGSNGQEWDVSWVEQDPRPSLYRFFRIVNPSEVVQTFSGCEPPNDWKNGLGCKTQYNYNIIDKRYVGGRESIEDYEFKIINITFQGEVDYCGDCALPALNGAGNNLHWYGGTVTPKTPTATDLYFIDDLMPKDEDIEDSQTYNVEDPINADTSSAIVIERLNEFNSDNQEASGSCVVANLENTLNWAKDPEKGKTEWDLILEEQFCGDDDGSHEFCASGTTEEEWTAGYNNYLDYCTITNYKNDGTSPGPLPTDSTIQAEIDSGIPVSLGFRWNSGAGHAGTIVGYEYEGPDLYWYINEPLHKLQKYSDVWLDYHTDYGLVGFSVMGIYNCDFPEPTYGHSSPLFMKRKESTKQRIIL